MSQSSQAFEQNIHSAAEVLCCAKKTAVLTGAGISTPSGIPDFRSTDSGLWEQYDPFEVASLTAFRYYPEKFYRWLRELAATIINARPNAAHEALARLQQAGRVKTIITQNIDGLHQRAGATGVIEVHGTLDTLTCGSCYRKVEARPYIDRYLEAGEMPRCPSCHGVMKPDVVLFGEQLPFNAWQAANQASKSCDLMIVAGSSLEVLPVAGLPMRALENGAHLILVNRSETYLDVRADHVFHEDLDVVLPALANAILGE